jgi:hypothetical protein
MENFRLMYVALSQDLDINAEQLPRLATQNSFNFGLNLVRVFVTVFKNICFLFNDALGTPNCIALNVNGK